MMPQPEMLAWIGASLMVARDLTARAGTFGDIAENLRKTLSGMADPTIDSDVPEQLAAIRVHAMYLSRESVHEDAKNAAESVLAVCDTIEADDGTPAALAKFRAARARSALAHARTTLRMSESMAKNLVPSQRPERRSGMGVAFISGFVKAVSATIYLADRASAELCPNEHIQLPDACCREPPEDEAGNLAWLQRRIVFQLEAGENHSASELMATLNAIETDDGSEVEWRSIAASLRRYMRVAAKARYDEAIKGYG